MTQNQKLIDPMVALAESQALVEHYRNRNLILAQEKRELELRLAEVQAEAGSPADEGDAE